MKQPPPADTDAISTTLEVSPIVTDPTQLDTCASST